MMYYVQSGELREIVNAKDPMEAFTCAYMRAIEKEPQRLGQLTICSEHGFIDSPIDIRGDDKITSTKMLLKKVGLEDKFELEDGAVDFFDDSDEGEEWKNAS